MPKIERLILNTLYLRMYHYVNRFMASCSNTKRNMFERTNFTYIGERMFINERTWAILRLGQDEHFFFPVPVCAITASGVPGGTLVSMNGFSTLCG
jgi:hypothetical protein